MADSQIVSENQAAIQSPRRWKYIVIVAVLAALAIIVLAVLRSRTKNSLNALSSVAETSTSAVKKFPAYEKSLSSEEEKKYGTNPQEFDTDGDGLSDYDEIKVWKTDPKKIDTDGDGFGDGYEVIKGYNPNGVGKLVE